MIWGRYTFLGSLLWICLSLHAAVAQDASPAQGVLADSAGVGADSLAAGQATQADSAQTQPVDPAWKWTTWKKLAQAIQLRPLDGPEDIAEKIEIIEDRMDELKQERKRLEKLISVWEERYEALKLQFESLDDLADVQRGGDLQLQQRVHTIRSDLRKAEQRMRIIKGSYKGIEGEIDRFEALMTQYEDEAAAIRRDEGGHHVPLHKEHEDRRPEEGHDD
jgi:prefoldin subunit 5